MYTKSKKRLHFLNVLRRSEIAPVDQLHYICTSACKLHLGLQYTELGLHILSSLGLINSNPSRSDLATRIIFGSTDYKFPYVLLASCGICRGLSSLEFVIRIIACMHSLSPAERCFETINEVAYRCIRYANKLTGT
jgi:hypothetical protein